MFAAQAEYRLSLPKRFGLVAFAGAGQVAKTSGEYRMDKMLPSFGAGIRFRLTKRNKVNFRLDYAVGKDSHGIYMGVGEVF
jgi:hemolysin activation/secretion protein